MSHRFATILAADVARFSQHMESDGEATVGALKRCRSVFSRCVSSHGGREFGTVGDSFMAEFPSPVEALRAARAIQSGLAGTDPTDGGEQLQVRIGLHAGDVITDGVDLFGDVVNTAARLQQLAQPGSIALSGFVHAQVRKEPDVRFRSLGQRLLKNIGEPVTVFEVVRQHRRFNWRRFKLAILPYRVALATTLGVIIAGAVFILYIETREEPGIGSTIEVQPPDNSIAALPFRPVGLADDDAWLADGIHAAVLIQLSKLSSLDRVISRTSVEKYRNAQVSIRQIGEELGVAKILEASVQQSSDLLRVNIELVDAIDDEQIWAQTYDREFTEESILAIQTEIARDVAAALHLALGDQEAERLQGIPTNSLEAWGEYVRGLKEETKRTLEALEKAEAHFRRAVDLDPDFALAYLRVADVLHLQWVYDGLIRGIENPFEERQELIERALSIDPSSGEAYTSLATLKEYQGEPEEAEQLFRKAIELSPNYGRAYHWYGMFMVMQGGRSEEALAMLERASELDPNEPAAKGAMVKPLQNLGRSQEAIDLMLAQAREYPDHPLAYFGLSDAYKYEGQLGEALRWSMAGKAIDPHFWLNVRTLCVIRIWMRDFKAARRCIEAAEQDFDASFNFYFPRMYVHLGLQEYDAARSLIAEVFDREDIDRYWKVLMLRYYMLFGDMQSLKDGLRRIGPDLFDEHNELKQAILKQAIEIDLTRPSAKEDLHGYANLLVMLYAGALLHDAGETDLADHVFSELLEFFSAAREVKRFRWDPGHWVSPMNDVWIHAIRQDGPLVIQSIRDSLDYPLFMWCYDDAPLFEFLRNDPEWIELMDEIDRRAALERQYYEQHKDEPLFSAITRNERRD